MNTGRYICTHFIVLDNCYVNTHILYIGFFGSLEYTLHVSMEVLYQYAMRVQIGTTTIYIRINSKQVYFFLLSCLGTIYKICTGKFGFIINLDILK